MIKERILISIAKATRKIAKASSSCTSFYLTYQPKVPDVLKEKNLNKDINE